jgi:hypothetical protein
MPWRPCGPSRAWPARCHRAAIAGGPVEPVALTQPQAHDGGIGDHGGVVGTKRERRRDKGRAAGGRQAREGGPDRTIGGHASGHGEGWGGRCQLQIAQERAPGLYGEDVGHGGLEGGAEICAVPKGQAALRGDKRIAGAQERGLEPREGEVAAGPVKQRTRQRQAGGIARAGLGLDGGPAGLWQAQKPRRLVEGFAGGVVDRAADAFEPFGGVDDQELAMPARDEQQEIGKGGRIGQPRGERVAGEVVDPEKGQAGGKRDRLGAGDARQKPADQAGARGRGDAVKVAQGDARPGKRLFGHDIHPFGMGAGGDVGDDAAKGRVEIGLPPDDQGQDGARAIACAHHGGGGFVAA